MPEYRVEFNTAISLIVTIDAVDEDEAADTAWAYASDYLATVHGDNREVAADVSLDGIGADTVTEVSA